MTQQEFLVSLLKSGVKLNKEHQLLLFNELENATEAIKAFLSRNAFSPFDNTQLLMFNRTDTPELVLHYISCGYSVNPELEYKLFELPNAKEILEIYTANHQLYSNLGQLKLFMFPNVAEILKIYISKGFTLNPKAQVKLFDLPAPYAEELVKLYRRRNFELCKAFKILAHKNHWNKN